MRFSKRSHWNREVNRLTRLADARGSYLDLTLSNPTAVGLKHPSQVYATLGSDGWARYEPDPLGLPCAREAVGRHEAFDSSRLVLTSSTSEAYGLLFKILADPGDVIAAPRPSYPLLETLARLEGLSVHPYDLRYDGSWYIDTESLAAAAEHARAVIVVNPNNPTGSYLDPTDFNVLRSLNRPIVSDEVFFAYPVEGPQGSRAIDQDLPLSFTLGGLSKLIALPQAKLSWIAIGGDPRWTEEALARLELVNDSYLSTNSAVQHATSALLEWGAPLRHTILERLRHNAETLSRATQGSACSCWRVEGGWSAVLRVPSTWSDEEWALQLLESDGVRVQPGYFYDHPGPESLLVLSLLTEVDCFPEGVARIVSRVEA